MAVKTKRRRKGEGGTRKQSISSPAVRQAIIVGQVHLLVKRRANGESGDSARADPPPVTRRPPRRRGKAAGARDRLGASGAGGASKHRRKRRTCRAAQRHGAPASC